MSLIPDVAAFRERLAGLPTSTYEPGEIVIAAGTTTERLLVLKEGVVEVVRNTTQIAKIAEPGAVFGELSALLDKPHTADVRALERSVFNVADSSALLADTAAPLYIALILARRLDAVNVALVDVRVQLESGKARAEVAKKVGALQSFFLRPLRDDRDQ